MHVCIHIYIPNSVSIACSVYIMLIYNFWGMDICYRINNWCALPGKDDLSLSLYFLVANSSLYKNFLS